MKLVIIFVLFVVFAANFVDSGVLLDNLKSGVSTTRNAIRCGVRKIGGIFGHNVNCVESNQVDKNNESDETSGKSDGHKLTNNKTSEVLLSASTENTQSAGEKFEGRRVIAVGSNCPEGFRGDGKGNCREDYS